MCSLQFGSIIKLNNKQLAEEGSLLQDCYILQTAVAILKDKCSEKPNKCF